MNADQEVTNLLHELARHPIQYAVSLNAQNPTRGTVIYQSEIIPTPRGETWERYNRCPECKQWSPCDRRKAILARLTELMQPFDTLAEYAERDYRAGQTKSLRQYAKERGINFEPKPEKVKTEYDLLDEYLELKNKYGRRV